MPVERPQGPFYDSCSSRMESVILDQRTGERINEPSKFVHKHGEEYIPGDVV